MRERRVDAVAMATCAPGTRASLGGRLQQVVAALVPVAALARGERLEAQRLRAELAVDVAERLQLQICNEKGSAHGNCNCEVDQASSGEGDLGPQGVSVRRRVGALGFQVGAEGWSVVGLVYKGGDNLTNLSTRRVLALKELRTIRTPAVGHLIHAEKLCKKPCAAPVLTVVEPHGEHGVDEADHHGLGVVRGGRDAQQLLPARHRRVVDRLHVDAVLLHQVVRQLRARLGVPDLRRNAARLQRVRS